MSHLSPDILMMLFVLWLMFQIISFTTDTKRYCQKVLSGTVARSLMEIVGGRVRFASAHGITFFGDKARFFYRVKRRL
jgi:hypothetical protein